jgi:hypothetical protein
MWALAQQSRRVLRLRGHQDQGNWQPAFHQTSRMSDCKLQQNEVAELFGTKGFVVVMD